MIITETKKEQLKKLLDDISTPDEKGELGKLDAQKVNKIIKSFGEMDTQDQKNYENILKSFNYLTNYIYSRSSVQERQSKNLEESLKKMIDSFMDFSLHSESQNKKIVDSFATFSVLLAKEFGKVGDKLSASYRENKVDPSGFFKDMGTQLTDISSYSKATSELIRNLKWNSSMQLRNQNGSPINPAQNDQATIIGTGTLTVTSAGVSKQLSTLSVPCVAVYIQAHESNVGTITVGDSNVVAALSGRRGLTLYPTNFQKFVVSNLNLLYVDATNSGDKIHYYYETV